MTGPNYYESMASGLLFLLGDLFLFLPILLLGMSFVVSIFTRPGSRTRRRSIQPTVFSAIFLFGFIAALYVKQTGDPALAEMPIGFSKLSPTVAAMIAGLGCLLLMGTILISVFQHVLGMGRGRRI